MLNNWRMASISFSGGSCSKTWLRKFLGNNMAIYFAKDFLVAIVYMSFFIAYRRKDKDLQPSRPPFFLVLAVFVWFGVLQVLTPAPPAFSSASWE